MIMRTAFATLVFATILSSGCAATRSEAGGVLAQRQIGESTVVRLDHRIVSDPAGQHEKIQLARVGEDGVLSCGRRIAGVNRRDLDLHVTDDASRAWVTDKSRGFVLLAIDFNTGQTWDDPRNPPAWAKP